MSDYETILVEVAENGAATITLNRPDKLNAINQQMHRELRQAFEELDNDSRAHVAVLRGAGRAFSAGADIDESEGLTPEQRVEGNRLGQKTCDLMEMMSIPIFAAVHRYALGGGLELALAADFIVCSDDARLGLPEITLSARPPYQPKIMEGGEDPDQPETGGQAPGWGAPKRLPERVGKAFAKEMMLTGAHIEAERAVRMGLVNDVYPVDEFDEKVAELADRMAHMNRYNLRLIKQLVSSGYDMIEPHPR